MIAKKLETELQKDIVSYLHGLQKRKDNFTFGVGVSYGTLTVWISKTINGDKYTTQFQTHLDLAVNERIEFKDQLLNEVLFGPAII